MDFSPLSPETTLNFQMLLQNLLDLKKVYLKRRLNIKVEIAVIMEIVIFY